MPVEGRIMKQSVFKDLVDFVRYVETLTGCQKPWNQLDKGAVSGRVAFVANTRQATQFCTFKPRMRRNSRSLLVTMVRSAALACAAIHKSLLPIGRPWDSSDARMVPTDVGIQQEASRHHNPSRCWGGVS
jgi:hypothetical protein